MDIWSLGGFPSSNQGRRKSEDRRRLANATSRTGLACILISGVWQSRMVWQGNEVGLDWRTIMDDREHGISGMNLELITPEKAEQMLEIAGRNRARSEQLVRRYAADMSDGSWVLTHQGIAIHRDGRVLDGQHRLAAIIVSGESIHMFVTRNLDDDAGIVIDTGKVRDLIDSSLFSGVGVISKAEASCSRQMILTYGNLYGVSRTAHLNFVDRNLEAIKFAVSLFAVRKRPRNICASAVVSVFARASCHRIEQFKLRNAAGLLLTGLPLGESIQKGDRSMMTLSRYLLGLPGSVSGTQMSREVALKTQRCLRAMLDEEDLEKVYIDREKFWTTPLSFDMQKTNVTA